jgi:hypothetical protein
MDAAMSDSPEECNPYAASSLPGEGASSGIIPRRWFWWVVCDCQWYSGITILLLAPTAYAAYLICKSRQLGASIETLFQDQVLRENAQFAAESTGAQIWCAVVSFMIVLILKPHLSPMFVRGMMFLAPVVGYPGIVFVYLYFWKGRNIAILEPIYWLVIVIGWVGGALAIFITARGLQGFLTPVNRLDALPPPGVAARLVRRGWMRRVFEVALPEVTVEVDYDGRRLGVEEVRVAGMPAARARSFLQLAPHFEFPVAGRQGELYVSGWPWPQLRSIVLAIDGGIVYREGF